MIETFQQRVINEREDLVIKLDKLTEFMKGPLFKDLSIAEQTRLLRQHNIMEQYANVLAERIVHYFA